MALVVEDGSNIPGANSFVDYTYFRLFALDRGVSGFTNLEILPHLVKATDYLEKYWDRFKGDRTYTDQVLSWPRRNVYLHGNLLVETTIPEELKKAQSLLAIESYSGNELSPTIDNSIKMEKVAVLEMEYFQGEGKLPYFDSVQAFLDPLLETSSGFFEVQRI